MEETVDGCVLRSVPRGRGSPAPERAVFRLATQRRAARHLGAQRGVGGGDGDRRQSSLSASSTPITVKASDFACADLELIWALIPAEITLRGRDAARVCVCGDTNPFDQNCGLAASQRLEKSVIAITQTLNLKSRSGAEICHGTSLCWGMDGLFEVILSKTTESHELIQLKFKHLEHRNWNHKAFTCSAPLTGAESNQAALNLEKVNTTVRMCIIRVTTALIHIKTLPWILHIHVLLYTFLTNRYLFFFNLLFFLQCVNKPTYWDWSCVILEKLTL